MRRAAQIISLVMTVGAIWALLISNIDWSSLEHPLICSVAAGVLTADISLVITRLKGLDD